MSRKEKKYHFIYKTIDTRNENFYIGMHSTDNLNDGYIGSGFRLKKLIYKHGKNIFKIEILEFLSDRELLKKREEEIVNSDLLNEEKCMNLKPGGSGGFCNEEHRQKFLEGSKKCSLRSLKSARDKQQILYNTDINWVNKRNKNISDSKIGNKSWLGKHLSDDIKIKIGLKNSVNQKGIKNSQYDTCWITNKIQNKKIKNIEIEYYEKLGWIKGRTLKIRL
jgi:hypothetical protein